SKARQRSGYPGCEAERQKSRFFDAFLSNKRKWRNGGRSGARRGAENGQSSLSESSLEWIAAGQSIADTPGRSGRNTGQALREHSQDASCIQSNGLEYLARQRKFDLEWAEAIPSISLRLLSCRNR